LVIYSVELYSMKLSAIDSLCPQLDNITLIKRIIMENLVLMITLLVLLLMKIYVSPIVCAASVDICNSPKISL